MSSNKMMQRKDRRNKLQIYFDILRAINYEISTDGRAKPTRVQYRSNMSYDKLSRYLTDLENKKLINKNPLLLSDKGRNFLEDYGKINDFVTRLGLDYLTNSEEEVN